MNWISRYLSLLETREANRANEAREALTFRQTKFAAQRADAEDAKRKQIAPTALVIPEDLEAVIMQESADWLREEMRQTYRKLYVEYGDWQKVRFAAGIGAMPETAS